MRVRTDSELLDLLEAAVRSGYAHGLYMAAPVNGRDARDIVALRTAVTDEFFDTHQVEVLAEPQANLRAMLNAMLDAMLVDRHGAKH